MNEVIEDFLILIEIVYNHSTEKRRLKKDIYNKILPLILDHYQHVEK